MNKDSVIFIEEPYFDNGSGVWKRFLTCVLISPRQLRQRIFMAFLPPILGPDSRRVYVDLIGPFIALIALGIILHFGHANKHSSAALTISPTVILFYYILIMPLVCLLMAHLGRAHLGPTKVLSLIGYGLYGHVFTLLTSLLAARETSNFIFFFAMTLFGGLSCFRIALVLLFTTPRPAARLLICSFVSLSHILFLIFIHFAYMHRTFIYVGLTENNVRLMKSLNYHMVNKKWL